MRIPYLGPSREELAVRFRIALDGDCFRWKSGSKPCLYGLNRFGDTQAARDVVLVEGEANVHTLWHHGIPAVGLPGVIDWREDRDAKCFNGVETIYIVVGAGKSEQVRKWLGQSAIRARAKLLELPADLSAMHITDFRRLQADMASGASRLGLLDGARSTAARRGAIRGVGHVCRAGSLRNIFSRSSTGLSRQPDWSVSVESPS